MIEDVYAQLLARSARETNAAMRIAQSDHRPTKSAEGGNKTAVRMQRIEAAFALVRSNPGSLPNDVALALGVTYSQACKDLCALHKEGRVQRWNARDRPKNSRAQEYWPVDGG